MDYFQFYVDFFPTKENILQIFCGLILILRSALLFAACSFYWKYNGVNYGRSLFPVFTQRDCKRKEKEDKTNLYCNPELLI